MPRARNGTLAVTPATRELTLEAPAPAPPDMQEHALLQRIVKLAALCCNAAQAGVALQSNETHRLLAAHDIVGFEPSSLPGVAPGEIVTFQPPPGSGLQFAAAIGLPDAALLFVLDDKHRTSLTSHQTQCLQALAAQARDIISLPRQLQTAAIYKRAFHAANVDLVLISIAPDGDIRLQDANSVHLGHLGVPVEQFIGRTPEEVLGPTAVFARQKYEQVITQKMTVEYEHEVPFPSGNRVRHSTMTPLFDSDGRVEKILLTSHDLTETRRAEAHLRQAQKIQALGQLTGGVAHDFNNLLTVIRGGLDLIEAQLARLPAEIPVARLRRARELAIQGVDRAAILTERLLAFARRQPLAPRPLDVNAMITGLSELLHRTLGETVELETILSSDIWMTEADGHQLENALLNLALNARDAMPQGGCLTIETTNASLGSDYVQTLAEEIEPGDYVTVAVTDTGCGMDQAIAEQVFEPFFTTKDQGVGTGLGLSQVLGFVRQSGGLVRLYSEPGQGTTVRIYLPRLLQAASERPATRVSAHDATTPTGTERVLVVEDEPALRDYTVQVLSELGYGVDQAGDAPAALAILQSEPNIQLLFTDVVLPGGMNGQLLAESALQLRPRLKVLFTTGYARNALMRNGRLEPGIRLLTKPFSLSDLARAVRNALDESG